jgi:1-deoxy-D-xylulose-5-phosphate reductoisomerase
VPAWDDFPCLRLAYRALDAERSLPIVLNAANEVAVESFLEGRLGFTGIAKVIRDTMDAHVPASTDTLGAIRAVDRWARDYATDLVSTRGHGGTRVQPSKSGSPGRPPDSVKASAQ